MKIRTRSGEIKNISWAHLFIGIIMISFLSGVSYLGIQKTKSLGRESNEIIANTIPTKTGNRLMMETLYGKGGCFVQVTEFVKMGPRGIYSYSRKKELPNMPCTTL